MKGKWENSGTRIVQYSMVLNLPSILEVGLLDHMEKHMFSLYGKRRCLVSNDISDDIESIGQALDNLIFAIHSSLLLYIFSVGTYRCCCG